MKKTYYYKETSKKKNKATRGFDVIASVYTVKNGKITKLGKVNWNTSSFKGEKSIIYTFLKNKKLVSVKEYKDNKGDYYPSKSKVIITDL